MIDPFARPGGPTGKLEAESQLAWDHNAYYHDLLLRHVPRACYRALDVGCGAGAFATRLAPLVDHVDALDRSPAMVHVARQLTRNNVSCILGDVLHYPLLAESYDAIFSITAPHHLPLTDALGRLGAALRPGDVLAAVSLPRLDLPLELPSNSPPLSAIDSSAQHSPRPDRPATAAGTNRNQHTAPCLWFSPRH